MHRHCSRALQVVAVLLALCVSACAPQRQVRMQPDPAARRPSGNPASAPGYTVVRGDTLYGIAFRHGLDYRELAKLNGIVAPYTIYPGQELKVTRAAPTTAADPRPQARTSADQSRSTPANSSRSGVLSPIPRSTSPASPGQTGAPASRAPENPTASVGRAADGSPTDAVQRGPNASAGEAGTSSSQASSDAVAGPAAPVALPVGAPKWRWPASGQVIGTYLSGDPTRQGINVAGDAGDPVHAAADGVVVYSGSGLIGYGELIIVKHNDTWLSAYGHNRKRLVTEGVMVRSGQAIAEMGRSGASRDMLHFEVRKNGRPVDPLGVLPRR